MPRVNDIAAIYLDKFSFSFKWICDVTNTVQADFV